nr:N-acetyltransferase [Candidatus Levybacteria bacterium]
MKSKFIKKEGTRVHRSAKVGARVIIWYGAQVGERAKIGENTIVGNNVYIDGGVIIGKN